jgi:hypothetical protein
MQGSITQGRHHHGPLISLAEDFHHKHCQNFKDSDSNDVHHILRRSIFCDIFVNSA